MPIRQKIFAILIAVAIFVTIIELVRRRKLKEEYSWFWLLTGACLFILAIKYDWLVAITGLIGAGFPTSTLFFFGIIFLILINLHFSIVLSHSANQIKNLTQELALLKNRVQGKG
jgi:hypothetical protein